MPPALADLVLMVGARLDNQMNFGNPPLFPKSTKLVCINGSHEEIELNRAADINLLCDPGVFLDTLKNLKTNNKWNLGQKRRNNWVNHWFDHISKETEQDKINNRKMHPLQLSLDVQSYLNEKDWLIFDGGNTHFWSEIAINIAGSKGKKIGGILHPGKPKKAWLNFVISAKAKNKINSSLKEEKKIIAADGKEILERKLKHLKLSSCY